MGLRVLILACRATGLESIKHILNMKRHTIIGVYSRDYEHQVNDGIICEDYRRLLDQSGVPFWPTDNLYTNENIDSIRKLKADIGLSIGWRRLVKEPIISMPKRGFVNFHTSDLPKYRGFASTSWAILNGDDNIAITAHSMLSDQADRGDILLKEKIPITRETDIGDLFLKIQSTIPTMVHHLLDQMEEGTIKSIFQNEGEAVLSFPRHPSDGWIDWTKSAEHVDRLVRSVAKPYPGAFTSWNMKKLIVWKGYVLHHYPSWIGVAGHVIGSDDGLSIKVLTGDGIYVITKAQLEGSDEVIDPAIFIKGVQQRLGISPGESFEILRTLLEKKTQ